MSLTSQRIKEKFNKVFEASYNFLNKEQKQAVDQIEGPVMVIAGPGTGKTQILAVRIGKILKQQDVSAHNILCLTFTEAASVAMRRRLVEIIGPEGHKVHIYTFHGFCNQVIQENLGFFGNYRKLDQLSDLESIDVYDEILDGLASDHILKRLKGDPRYEAKRLGNLFQLMKRENLDSDKIAIAIKTYYQDLEDAEEEDKDPKFYYRRKYKEFVKGDKKPKPWKELKDKMAELQAAADLYSLYVDILARMGRYDYADMILWVVKAFQENDDILSKYQERYHYFLVDEYQDTNGAQNELLYQLINFMDLEPNAFVVGDDDQAIYKFQGANLNNIKKFKSKYKPVSVLLENNYRSSQLILDAASDLIDINTERIINDDDEFAKKNLIAAGDRKALKIKPLIKQYNNVIHEQADIVDKLSKMYSAGEDLNEVAVLYRNHAQVAKMVEVLEKKNIPLNIKKKVDILKLPLVKNTLNILYYLQSEYDKPNSEEVRLFELMHYHFFEIDARDIAKIAIYKKSNKNEENKNWRDIIGDKDLLNKIEVKSLNQILALNDLLSKWVADIANLTLQSLYEAVINEGHILQTVLNSPDKTWLLQVVSTLFDIIKNDSKKKPDIKLKEFLNNITKMSEAELPLEINRVVNSKQGIHFMTAHSSKGLEFEKVFLMGCTKNKWDTNKGNRFNYTYPSSINGDVDVNQEDERRLFFVAMTRAKSVLEISYSVKTENDRDLSESQFVNEIKSVERAEEQIMDVDETVVNDFQHLTMLLQHKEVKLIDHDLIDESLKRFKLSVTNLSKYLKCPMTFYFETILRVPTARNKYMGFGSAMHQAFQDYYQDIEDKQPYSLESFITHFMSGMNYFKSHFTDKEFKDLSAYGKQILTAYHETYLLDKKHENHYFLEEKIEHAEWKGVPLKGVLDNVEVFKDYVNVVDYKTGNGFKSDTKAKLKKPTVDNLIGGDYWRQIVFYKILLNSDKKHDWNMVSGEIDFVEPKRNTSEFTKAKIVVSPAEIELVGEQIEETWKNINDHNFGTLCEEEKCYWCNFVRDEYVFSGEFEQDALEDNQDF